MSNRKTKITKETITPLYGSILVVSNDTEHLNKYLAKTYPGVEIEVMPSAGSVSVFDCPDSGARLLAMVLDHCTMQVLCHESIHAAFHVLDRVGIKVDADNHEALTYLTDWIFEFARVSLKVK